ncbi:MAG: hypothetical protein WC568_11800 [Candidatus Methanoperedens sp.]
MLTIYYIGFELDKGYIEVGTADNMLGTCMRGGKIVAQKAGNELLAVEVNNSNYNIFVRKG